MQKSLSVRKAARYVGISKGTASAWRHKFLSSLTSSICICNYNGSDLSKTAKIFSLPYPAKGRQKAPEANREQSSNLLPLEKRQIKLKKIFKDKAIKTILSEVKTCDQTQYIAYEPNKLLCAALAKTERICLLHRDKTIKPLLKEIKKEQQKIIQLLNRFHGVASRYLQQ